MSTFATKFWTDRKISILQEEISNPVGFGGGDHATVLKQFLKLNKKRQVSAI